MSRTLPSWDLLATFLAVMRQGSLSGAARDLRLTQPTIRRQIEALEQALGVVLFTRSPNGLTPTEAALRTLPHAEAMAATAAALVRGAAAEAEEGQGSLRLTASEVFAAEILPPILARLMQRHPGLEIEIVPSNRTEDLLRRDADVAVRLTRPTQAALVARRIGRIEFGLYASPAYLARHSPPRDLADLITRHGLIGDDRNRDIASAFAAKGIDSDAIRFVYRSDSHLAQLAALRAGIGIGICQPFVAAGGACRLQRLLPELGVAADVFVVTHEDLRAVGRVRLVFDHLVESLTTDLLSE